MTKAEHIAYWREAAADDWLPVQRMVAAGSYSQGLFFAWVMVEKLSKAHWVQHHADTARPPRNQPLPLLWQQAHLAPAAAHLATLAELNHHNPASLYPAPGHRRAPVAPAAATRLLADVASLRAWLLNGLPAPH